MSRTVWDFVGGRVDGYALMSASVSSVDAGSGLHCRIRMRLTTRIVADTNVLVSGLGWAGPCAQVLDAVHEGRLALVQGPPLLSELRRVLAYPKARPGDP